MPEDPQFVRLSLRLRRGIELPIYAAALPLVLLGVLAILFWAGMVR